MGILIASPKRDFDWPPRVADVDDTKALDVVGDVGNCDSHNPAIGVTGIAIRFGMDGIVMIAGIGWIDGNQRQVAQVGATS